MVIPQRPFIPRSITPRSIPSRPISSRPISQKPIPQKPIPPKPTFPDGCSRERFRKELKGAHTPGQFGQLKQKERIGLEKTLFPYKGYGSLISQKDIKTAVGKLKKTRSRIPGGRIAKKRQINLLKRIGGF